MNIYINIFEYWYAAWTLRKHLGMKLYCPNLTLQYVNPLAPGWFWRFSAKKTPKRTWLCG